MLVVVTKAVKKGADAITKEDSESEHCDKCWPSTQADSIIG
jgi:hypothetical protein